MLRLTQRFIDLTGLRPRPLARFCAVVSFTAGAAAWTPADPPAWLIVLVSVWYGCIFYASGHEVFREHFTFATLYSRRITVGFAVLYLIDGLDLLDVKLWFEVFALYLLVVKDPPPPRPRHEPQPSPVS